MRKFIFLTLFVVLLLIFKTPSVGAALVECDSCGYCQGQTPPENWSSCAQCLYPGIVSSSDVADSNKTLQIYNAVEDPNNPGNTLQNKPAQPAQGKYYTQLGCLDTGLVSFRDNPGAAGALVNFILNTLLFPIAGTLAFGVIMYGAFLLLTAQGDQMKIALGKKLVTSSIIGVVFTFSSVFILTFIASDVLKIPGFTKGTRVTFVGYGTPTTEASVQTYPELTVFLDNKEVGKIESIQGNAAAPQTKDVYLPTTLDLNNPTELNRVELKFTNDLCLSIVASGSSVCCPPENTDPRCQYRAIGNDRNISNTRILFDGRTCTRRINTNGDVSTTDGQALRNWWQNISYKCTALAP